MDFNRHKDLAEYRGVELFRWAGGRYAACGLQETYETQKELLKQIDRCLDWYGFEAGNGRIKAKDERERGVIYASY